MEELKLINRINLLKDRQTECGKIIKKLERQLRRIRGEKR